jgi:hypothetical protein
MAKRKQSSGVRKRAKRGSAADYDSPWKEALDHYFDPCMRFFFPQAHADIDWGRGHETLDKELQQIVRSAEHGRRYVDKLVKVWLKSGEERWLLIHVEVQTSREIDFPKRMYVYNYRIFDRYDREAISLAILADDDPDWRPSEYGYRRWGFHASMKFPIIKLLDYASQWYELEKNPNPFAVVVLAHLKTLETRQDPAERKAWKVRLVKGLYERGLGAEDARRLLQFIDWVMDLPPTLKKQFWEEVYQYEEEQRMPYMMSNERMAREESLRKGIEVALKIKFGEPGLKLMPEIGELEDHELLLEVLEAIPTAGTPDELRKLWES